MTRRNGSLILALTLLTLGLTAVGIWSDVVGYSMNLFSESAISSLSGNLSRNVFLLGRMFSCIALIIFARYIPKAQTTLTIAISLIMSAATGALVLSYHQTLFDPDTLAIAGVFISSMGYIFMVSIFYVYFARKVSTESAVMAIAASLVLETVFSVLISLYLSPSAQAIVVTLTPLLACMLYFLGAHLSIETPDDLEPHEKLQGPSRNVLVIEVILFTVVLVFIRALSGIGIWGKERTNFIGMMEMSVGELILVAAFVLTLAFLVFILPRKRFSLFIRCIFGFAVMVTGLQVLALANDYQFGESFDTLTNSIELFSHLTKWMITIECIRQTDIPAFRVTSLSGPIYAAIALVWIDFIEGSEFVTSTFVMIIVYVLFLAAIVLLLLNVRLRGALIEDGENTVEQDVRHLAVDAEERWQLSPRESEVLVYLLEGKKRAEICKACGMSEGTVKTHINNIYRKMDVHSKKEMLQLIEGGSTSDTEKPASDDSER